MSILTSVLLFAAAFLPDDAISLGPLGGSATSVWVDPADADVLLITHPIKGLQRSEDGGVTFAPFGSGLPTDLAPQALTADPQSSALFIASDDRIFRSQNADSTHRTTGSPGPG